MPVYFLTGDPPHEGLKQIERQVRTVIPDVVRIVSLDDILRAGSRAGEERHFVLLVGSTEKGRFFEELLKIATRFRSFLFFIVISDDISGADYKRLVQTGGADWVSARGNPSEILDIVKRNRTTTDLATGSGLVPVAVAFVPSAGGVGTTTLASEIGVGIKAAKSGKGRRVCLVDLDFQTSNVCDRLDIEPRFQIEEICSDPDRLDAHLFDIFTSRHASGLDVFASPRSKFDLTAVNVAALDALFKMISKQYDLVLIDLPTTWYPWTHDIVANSDCVLIPGLNTIPGLRQMAETFEAVRGRRTNRGTVAGIVNRCSKSLFGGIERRHHVEHLLPKERLFYVGNDEKTFVECVNTGTPAASEHPGRAAVKDIAQIAKFCAELRSEALSIGAPS